MRLLLVLLFTASVAQAEGEKGGDFDYYLLALSWSPNWCALEGDARGAQQCKVGRELGWVLHGLWPQHESGWPSNCRSPHADASRAVTGAMADIMGSSGSAWHQWKKHGRCSGLSARDYFAQARAAYDAVTRPAVLRKLDQPIRLPAHVIEAAFIQVNPDLRRDMITITCEAGAIQEARLCLTKDLEARICGSDVVRDCQMSDADFAPIR